MTEKEPSLFEQITDIRVILFLTVYLAILIATAFWGYSLSKQKIDVAVRKEMNTPVVYNLSRMKISMSTVTAEIGNARVEMSLQVAAKDAPLLPSYMPRIMDRIQTTLSHTDIEAIKKRSTANMVREDLLLQVNSVSGPIKIQDIYFQKFLTPH